MKSMSDILKAYQLRNTASREDVLTVFRESETALSHGEIEKSLESKFDRVTIYRTLKTFVEKGIIHKVLDEDGLRYALCKEACSHENHKHDHIHFKCLSCGETKCIENIHIPEIALPEGYEKQDTNLLIQGICPICKKNS